MSGYGFLKKVLNAFVQIILPYKLIGREKELPEEEYRHEAVEACPHCGNEHYEKDWSPKKGYRARCMHCGESILLCDECLHADDNPNQACDWDKKTGKCFRD